MAIAAYCLLVFFALLGVVAGVYLLMMLFTRPKGRFVVVVPPQAREDEVASLLCAARLRVGLMGDVCCSDVIALDCGMGERCRLQCEGLCREMDHILLLKPEQLLEQLTVDS